MDEYTLKTKKWLDDRFRMTDKQGVYFAHQPIYGFGSRHCEPDYLLEKYSRTYEIMKMLSCIEFQTLIDIGGAEGYKAAMIKKIFNTKVVSSDISEEACRRAKEIYNIKTIIADIHKLPFQDNEFDVALCSETLEHVTDIKKAVYELLRVAQKAVIITVPHEPEEIINNNIKNNEMHGHIHAFDLNSMDFLKLKGYKITTKKITSQFIVDFEKSKFVNNKIITAIIMQIDSIISPYINSYYAILFVILKDLKCLKKRKYISTYQILNFQQPLHYIS